MPCCINVSYPQLRELKGAEPMFQYVLDDVSYPQLRELKLNIYGYAACYAECILPAVAGIETRCGLHKRCFWVMYLTRNCGN